MDKNIGLCGQTKYMYPLRVLRVIQPGETGVISVSSDPGMALIYGQTMEGVTQYCPHPLLAPGEKIEPEDLVIMDAYVRFPPNMQFIDFRVVKVIKSKTGKEILTVSKTPQENLSPDAKKAYG